MEFIDTHIHLQDYKQKCATDIIKAAEETGLKKLVCAAVLESDWKKIAAFAADYPKMIVPAFGLHPWYLHDISAGWQTRLEQMLVTFPAALVGETGLDRLRNPDKQPQFDIFLTHISLAKKYCRPLLVHSVKAAEWLDECWKILPQKFVMHSFNGRMDLLQKAVKAGGYISFSASILKNRDKEQLIRAVPAGKLLVETDGPYQSAEKDRESSPDFIPRLIEAIAEIREEKSTALAQKMYQNSLEFIKPW